jgi:ParB-like chromosome segregation protein Spo0J
MTSINEEQNITKDQIASHKEEQRQILLNLSELNNSPWKFRLISSKDFENLVSSIETYGPHTINPILVAHINEKYYIIDGHTRRDALTEAGFHEAACIVADWVRNFRDLRIWSFKLNRSGHYNPLRLLRMIKEDLSYYHSIENLANEYGVQPEYMKNILKLQSLHESAVDLVEKVINIAKKRYQFVLEQITASHLSLIAELEPDRQREVLEWLFHDIIHGPPVESLVSLPSIYEIMNAVERNKQASNRNNDKVERRKYKTHGLMAEHLQFRCSCGRNFHVDLPSCYVYQFLEKDDLIIKQEVEVHLEGKTIQEVSANSGKSKTSSNRSKKGKE